MGLRCLAAVKQSAARRCEGRAGEGGSGKGGEGRAGEGKGAGKGGGWAGEGKDSRTVVGAVSAGAAAAEQDTPSHAARPGVAGELWPHRPRPPRGSTATACYSLYRAGVESMGRGEHAR